jgi:hypothetical protein
MYTNTVAPGVWKGVSIRALLVVVEMGVGVAGAKAQLRGSDPCRPIAKVEGDPSSPEVYWREVWEIGDWPIFMTPTHRRQFRHR